MKYPAIEKKKQMETDKISCWKKEADLYAERDSIDEFKLKRLAAGIPPVFFLKDRFLIYYFFKNYCPFFIDNLGIAAFFMFITAVSIIILASKQYWFALLFISLPLLLLTFLYIYICGQFCDVQRLMKNDGHDY